MDKIIIMHHVILIPVSSQRAVRMTVTGVSPGTGSHIITIIIMIIMIIIIIIIIIREQ